MEFNVSTIENLFEFYENNKSTDEYYIRLGDKDIRADASLFNMQKNTIYKTKTHKYNDNRSKLIVRKKTIDRFHPNNIDNKKFWTLSKEKFPLISVCGSPTSSIDDCNEKTLAFAKTSGIVDFINSYANIYPELNFFEIGYGHGNMFFHLKDNHKGVNYLGIDYYKIPELDGHQELRTIDKSGIPDYIEDGSQNIIYSFNVLQHCSEKDRYDYLQQGYNKLGELGVFIGGCFLETDENKDNECWGVEDLNGKKYCTFFNQLTEVDTIEEFVSRVDAMGYTIGNIKQLGINYFSFVLFKN